MLDTRQRRFLRTQAAAEFVNKSPSTLEKLRVSGGGPVFIKIGRSVLYDEDDLIEWLRNHRRQSTTVGS